MKTRIILKNEKPYPVLAILIYYLFILLMYVVGLPLGSRTIATILAAIAMSFTFAKYIRKNIKMMLFFPVTFICWGAAYIHNGNYSYVDLITTFSYFFIAIGFVDYRTRTKDNSSLSLNIIGVKIYTYIVLITIFLLQIKLGFSTDAKVSIFYHLSHNYVSVIGLAAVIPYYISFENLDNSHSSVFPAVLYAVTSFLSTGRSGIITAGVVLIYVLYCRFIKRIKKRGNQIIAIFVSVIIYILLFVGMMYSSIGQKYLVRFIDRGMESQRSLIWREYINLLNSDMKSLFFGAKLLDVPYLSIRNELNIHNSFIQAQASLGSVFLFLLIIYIFKALKWYFSCDRTLFLLFIALIIRAFTDRIFYAMFMEPFLYFFLIFPIVMHRTFFFKNWDNVTIGLSQKRLREKHNLLDFFS